MLIILDMGVRMAREEKNAWIFGAVAVIAYVTYVVVVVSRAGAAPLADVAYVAPLLWSVALAILANVVLGIIASATSRREATLKDQRDREISRRSELIGQSFVVAGAVAAMLMAMAQWDYFWIANVIYLAFVLSAVLASVARIVAYRAGFPWE
jgi:hypothetical protein